MPQKYFIGNWKMNPQSIEEAKNLITSADNFFRENGSSRDVVIGFCPPFVFIEDVARALKDSSSGQAFILGSQDIATESSGAWTGEVSASMLKNIGVQHVIVGHSERRWKMNESDELVNKKLKAVVEAGLVPIVCIGERERNENYRTFISDQLQATFKDIQTSSFIIAYEPVWAISSNPGAEPDNPESAVESIQLIREIMSSQLDMDISGGIFLYGGSVNPINAKGFLEKKEIDGVLVGGASVKKDDLISLLAIMKEVAK